MFWTEMMEKLSVSQSAVRLGSQLTPTQLLHQQGRVDVEKEITSAVVSFKPSFHACFSYHLLDLIVSFLCPCLLR